MNRFPGFVAETSLKPSRSAYRGAAGCATSKAIVVGARIARQTHVRLRDQLARQ